MKKTVILPLLGFVLAGLSCQRLQADTVELGLRKGSYLHDEIERTYWLHVPPGYWSSDPHRAVVALHGGGGTGSGMCRLKNGFMELSHKENFLLICPDGFERHWNDGREIQRWRAHQEGIDDVGFLTSLIDQLAEQYDLDSSRIYVTGISNGGLMSYRLACERPEAFRAIAAVTASLPVDLTCQPDEPISVLVMNGTKDPLVPYDGGPIKLFRREVGVVRPTAETIEFWIEKNGCQVSPKVTFEPDRDLNDQTRVRRESFEICDQGTEVILYEVQGGGHTWPSSSQYLPESMIGRVSQDIDASQLIWDFFFSQTSGEG